MEEIVRDRKKRRRGVTYVCTRIEALSTITSMQEECLVALNEAELIAEAFNLFLIVIGEVVYNEWKWHIASAKEDNSLRIHQNGSLGTFSGDWPFLSIGSYLDDSEMLRGSLSTWSLL